LRDEQLTVLSLKVASIISAGGTFGLSEVLVDAPADFRWLRDIGLPSFWSPIMPDDLEQSRLRVQKFPRCELDALEQDARRRLRATEELRARVQLKERE
jgi:hypothetical protein